MTTFGRRQVLELVGILGTVLLLALGATAPARADVFAPADFAPSIWSDKADYMPGEHVVLSGRNWQPGESVHIVVNDDQGSTWKREADVTANDAGDIRDEFDLPDRFVAHYTVDATGSSGATAQAEFTDGNVKAQAAPANVTFSLTVTKYSSTNCTSGGGTPQPISNVDSGGTNAATGNNTSVKLVAASTSDQGTAFQNWSTGPNVVSRVGGTLCVTGSDSGTQTYTATYAAPNSNVAPAISATNSSVTVDEGQTATNSGTYSDSNAGDTVGISASVGNVTKTGTNGGTWSWSFGTTDGPAQSQTVTITANDGHGGVTTTSFALTVKNVAPAVTVTGPASANEGDTKTYGYTVSDVPGDNPTVGTPDCGSGGGYVAGSLDTSAKTFKCSFPDGAATTTVKLSATDKDGGTGSGTQSVAVANVAPVVTLSGPTSADEGQTKTYGYTVSDVPGDNPTVGTPDCGSGGNLVAGSLDTSAKTFRCEFPDGPAAPTVKLDATDKDHATGGDKIDVAVANVAPTADLANDGPINEGDSATVSFGNQSDPSAPDTSTGFHYDIACDGIEAHLASSYAAVGSGSSKSCTFADNGSYTVRGRILDKDGGATTYTSNVSVDNVAPKITSFTGTDTIAGPMVFAPSTFKTVFTDPGADTWSADFTYSDGTPLTQSVGSFKSGDTVTHRFATSGCARSATVKVTDDDGGSDAASATVKVGIGAFQPPMTDQPVTDKLKNGQVLPVKIKITDCNGVAVTNLSPSIVLKKGDLTEVADNSTDVITVPTSVSSADATGVMRASGDGYMYNMKVSVPSADVGFTPYTVVIYPYGGTSGPSMRHKILATK